MVKNIFRDSDIVNLYYIHVIPYYGSVMLILRWCYDYLFFVEYIWIYKGYDSDEMPLTQMFLQRNLELNDEDENKEDEEDNAKYVEMSLGGSNECTLFFLIYITSLC